MTRFPYASLAEALAAPPRENAEGLVVYFPGTGHRLKLKQAFGRLVRRADDHGVFVLLDKAMPSRLLTAFPPGVTVERLGLAEVVRRTAAFLVPPAVDENFTDR